MSKNKSKITFLNGEGLVFDEKTEQFSLEEIKKNSAVEYISGVGECYVVRDVEKGDGLYLTKHSEFGGFEVSCYDAYTEEGTTGLVIISDKEIENEDEEEE